MRVLFHTVKDVMVAHAHGVIKVEEAFLAYTEVVGPDGEITTVGELVGPQLARRELPSMDAAFRALPSGGSAKQK